jgi:DNA topoisomerase-1
MAVAQQLYEGVSVGNEGEVGLITYMRTDSTQMADTAVQEARRFIGEQHGAENVSPEPRTYRTRSRLAQEAHEAIRATSAFRTPEQVTKFLSRDQARLYELIWKRFVATQMASARLEITSVDIDAAREGSTNRYQFRAAGSVLTFPGFLSLYQEARDEDAAATDEDRQPLPPLEKGEALDLISLTPEQHFTQPPPRFTEASLVKALEERGVGRPSTYAPTISTLKTRNYVDVESRRLQPTPLGSLVTDLLIEHFPTVVDVDFTAGMEEQLDDIAEGRSERVPVLREFYGPFSKALTAAETQMERVKPAAEATDEVCEKCGRPMVIKFGRFGRFLACTGFPECKNARPIVIKVGALCPKCEAPILQRRTKTKRTFYGCSRYPECDWTSWSRPLEQPCPSCGGLLVESGRERAKCTQCGKIIPISELEPVPEAAAR